MKAGVLSALNLTTEFRSVEFGEDYALWLQNIKRNQGNGDTIIFDAWT